MRYVIFLVLLFPTPLFAQKPVSGPAYAAQMKAKLRKLQQAEARNPKPKLPSGPAYAAQRKAALSRLRVRSNYPVSGRAYAAINRGNLAAVRFADGTWVNNLPGRPTFRPWIRYKRTGWRPPTDPYMRRYNSPFYGNFR